MNLSPEIKLTLESRVRQTKDLHERLRLCVILSRSEGISPELIAQTHRISVQSVYRYLTEYEKESKIQNAIKGGTASKLNSEQTQELLNYLEIVTYLKAKDVCSYVKNTYNLDYSVIGMTVWLRSHGFVYKEPIKVPGKLDPEKQKVFINTYEQLKSTLPENAQIYFIDAVHPEFQSQAVCGWIKRGETKTLPTTNKQSRMHIIGALNIESMHGIYREYDTVDATNMIDFLKHLEESSEATLIHIISDNGRANKNKAIDDYLKTSKCTIHYLPAYSPNLNPIERLWKIMRERKTYNKCYNTFSEFKQAIHHFFFEEIPKIGDVLRKRINDKFQEICLNPIVLATA